MISSDNYVHRLLQSKGDGKIVAVNSEGSEVFMFTILL